MVDTRPAPHHKYYFLYWRFTAALTVCPSLVNLQRPYANSVELWGNITTRFVPMPACSLCKPESIPCICLGCNHSGPYMQETLWTPPRMDYEHLQFPCPPKYRRDILGVFRVRFPGLKCKYWVRIITRKVRLIGTQ